MRPLERFTTASHNEATVERVSGRDEACDECGTCGDVVVRVEDGSTYCSRSCCRRGQTSPGACPRCWATACFEEEGPRRPSVTWQGDILHAHCHACGKTWTVDAEAAEDEATYREMGYEERYAP